MHLGGAFHSRLDQLEPVAHIVLPQTGYAIAWLGVWGTAAGPAALSRISTTRGIMLLVVSKILRNQRLPAYRRSLRFWTDTHIISYVHASTSAVVTNYDICCCAKYLDGTTLLSHLTRRLKCSEIAEHPDWIGY